MLFILLVAAPFGTGLMINRYVEKEVRSIGVTYISGFLILLAAFQLLTVPIVFMDPWGFDKVVKFFTLLLTLLTGFGIIQALHFWRAKGRIFNPGNYFWKKSKMEMVQWGMVFALIFFQLFMAVTHASFDGDDAYSSPPLASY